jgi:hypothetical protein
MSRWFRLDDDVINDPKILLLPEAMRWIWVAFLCIASKNSGQLPSNEIIALSLRVKPTKAAEYLTRLCIAGLIDKTETGFAPHNWARRQFKSDVSTDRVKRFRKQERNVSETPPHTQAHTETQTKKDPPLRVEDDWPENFGDLFWQAYPRKEEKISAMRKLASLRKSGIVTFADLMAGVKRYCSVNREPQFTKQPTAWLTKGCWADEIKPGGGHGDRTGNTRTTGHDAILAVAARKARELDRNDDMAGPTNSAGFAFGDGTDRSGPNGNSDAIGRDHPDHHRVEPDDQRIREGEIIPPDKDAAGFSGRREFVR